MLASVSAWRLRAVARRCSRAARSRGAPSEPEGQQPSCRRGRGSSALVARGHVAKFRLDPQLGACALVPVPLVGRREGQRARTPSVQRARAGPPGRWVGPWRSPPPTPRSKPVTQASRLVAQETAPLVAFRLGPGSWPQGQPLIDSTPISGGYVRPDLNSLLGLVRGRGHPLIALRGQPAARSTARIRGWPSISSSSTTSSSSRPTMRPSRLRPSEVKPQ